MSLYSITRPFYTIDYIRFFDFWLVLLVPFLQLYLTAAEMVSAKSIATRQYRIQPHIVHLIPMPTNNQNNLAILQ